MNAGDEACIRVTKMEVDDPRPSCSRFDGLQIEERNQEVDSELPRRLVCKPFEYFDRVVRWCDHPETASVGHRRCKSWDRDLWHPGELDRNLAADQLRERSRQHGSPPGWIRNAAANAKALTGRESADPGCHG